MHDAQFYLSSILIKKKDERVKPGFFEQRIILSHIGENWTKIAFTHFFESLTKLLRMFMVDVSECG
jgi:hypothetical protein